MFSSLLDSHCSSFCLKRKVYCLVLLQVPEYFVLVQIFWASPKIWLHLVPHQKPLKRQKNQFYWMQIIFLSGTKCLWLPQYVIKFLDCYKMFGPAQNILGPVKGQGIYIQSNLELVNCQIVNILAFVNFFEMTILPMYILEIQEEKNCLGHFNYLDTIELWDTFQKLFLFTSPSVIEI